MNFLKSKGFITAGIIILIVIIIIAAVAGSYNGLVKSQTSLEEAYADIDTQLQRRSDLIPNLVSTVKGYASHEEEVFKDVSDARAALASAGNIKDKSDANSQLDSAVSRLLAIAENYPELKANENFLSLQDELSGTENRISVARTRYNEAAKSYNVKVRKFPTNIFANIFGFDKADYFEAAESAKNAPQVSFE